MGQARGNTVVIGIGNPDRGDDGIGHAVARALHARCPKDTLVITHSGEATSLLAAMDGAARVLIVDACRSGAPAGTLHRLDVTREPLPTGRFGFSSHGFGLAEAIELARALDQMPRQCLVYAVEGVAFDVGAGLSPAVAGVIDDVAARLAFELGQEQEQEAQPHA